MKVFIGLDEIAGYYSNLKKGFDQIGVKSVFVTLNNHPFQYSPDQLDACGRMIKHVTQRLTTSPPSHSISRIVWTCLMRLAILWASLKYDAFIFAAGFVVWGPRALAILGLLHKKVICVFHGSEVRPSYINYKGLRMTPEEIISQTRERKEWFRSIERYADAVIVLPTTSQLWERRLIHFLIIGLPYRFEETLATQNPSGNRAVRILHSPSVPEAKGTLQIRKAIRSLQERGRAIDYAEISGKPNAAVLEELVKCDFVVDQVYSDIPMAGFAMEAAFFGKPAVVGGYGQAVTRMTVPAHLIPPSYFCHPDEVESAIEKLIVDETFRLELGGRAREFVRANWSADKVAERYLQIIRGNIPEDWLFDPKQIAYVHGAGLSECDAKALIRSVIEVGGKEALQVSDKPELERRLVEFAYSKPSNLCNSDTTRQPAIIEVRQPTIIPNP